MTSDVLAEWQPFSHLELASLPDTETMRRLFAQEDQLRVLKSSWTC